MGKIKISENSTFIVAEIGNNHEGSFELAKKMILLASESGADAVGLKHIILTFMSLVIGKIGLKSLNPLN